MKLRQLFIFTAHFLFAGLFCQELPPMFHFTPETYKAANQNWMLGQHNNGYIYVANNDGLLEYNGSFWKLYPSPNETIIRSVNVIGNKVYTGAYMDFGFWEKDQTGMLKYISLPEKLNLKVLEDEQFWNIIEYSPFIVFQSLSQLYILNTDTNSIRTLKAPNGIAKSYFVNGNVFFQTPYNAIYLVTNGEASLYLNDALLQTNKVINMFMVNGRQLLLTEGNGFYEVVNNTLVKWGTTTNQALENASVYSAIKLKNGGFAVGTISKGLMVFDAAGSLKYTIAQKDGINNNTVLSLFEDSEGNLWMGLDNGLECINATSSILKFNDKTGILGTVYAIEVYNGNLYLGTNQGLFVKPENIDAPFTLVPGTNGQVWSLFKYDNRLFCGHDKGTFVIDGLGNTAKIIFNSSGTWMFSTVANQENVLLQGNYEGISVLKKEGNEWAFSKKINGFDLSAKHFVATDSLEVFVSHEYKGVFRFTLDNKLNLHSKVEVETSAPKGKNAAVSTLSGNVFYASKEGFFSWSKSRKVFEIDSAVTKTINENGYASGKCIADTSGRLWFFSLNDINYLTNSLLSDAKRVVSIPVAYALINPMNGYETLVETNNNTVLIGSTDGYLELNVTYNSPPSYKIYLDNVLLKNIKGNSFQGAVEGGSSFNQAYNHIAFSVAVPEYNKFATKEYSFRLKGYNDEWGPWAQNPKIEYNNLPFGSYTFEAKAKISNIETENSVSYNFTIKRPWYFSYWALALYMIGTLGLVIAVHNVYKKYYQNQQQKIIEESQRKLEYERVQNEKVIIELNNKQLQNDIENKNRELAASTMSLIKKNEFLTDIRNKLKNSQAASDPAMKSVFRDINKDLNEEDTWNLFKEAFNNVDKDFLNKVKALHPALTPNDLRLCAYLRLNLSSKEIAPLLNISARSVEVKRYRLRKKMDLPHDDSLVEYVLSI